MPSASTSSSAPNKIAPYPSPFLDVASTTLPNTVKELFKFTEHYSLSNAIVKAAIRKQSQYPITSIVYDVEDDSSEVKKKWKELLEEILDFPEVFGTINENYYSYGNVFISIKYPIIKYLQCTACGETFQVSKLKTKEGKKNIEVYNGKLVISQCSSCRALTPPTKVTDMPVKDKHKIRLILWDPNRIDIKHNKVTGRSKYAYDIEPKLKKEIMALSIPLEDLEETDQVFIEAALQPHKVAVFSDKQLFHMKTTSLAGVDAAWGYPQTVALLKDLYHLQIIKKANEAVMLDHMVPFRYLYPQTPPGDLGPATINMASWHAHMKREVTRWRNDPNYIGVMPFPAGQGMFGGQGKALLAQAEMNEMNRFILAGLGIPQEFIYGGLQWSGSNVSLKMLENEFRRIRKYDLQILKFCIQKISKYLGINPIPVHFDQFRMADDSQKKQFFYNLYLQNLVSWDTLLEEFELSSETEIKKMKAEVDKLKPFQEKQTMAKADIEVKAQIMQEEKRMKAQMEMQKTMAQYQQAPGVQPGSPSPSPMQKGQAAQQSPATQPNKQPGEVGQAQKKEQVVNPQGSPTQKPPRSENTQ